MMQTPRLLRIGVLWISLTAFHGCYRPPPPDLGLRPLVTHQATNEDPEETHTGPLTCEQSVQLGVHKHPTLRSARAGLKVSIAEVEGIGMPGNFEIRMRESVTAPGEDSRIGLRWNLPRPGAIDASRYAAQARVQLSRAEIRLMEAELGAQIRHAHLAVRRARADVQHAAGKAELATERLTMVRTRLAAGTTTRVAVSTAELNERATLADLKLAEAQHREAEKVFALWTAGGSVSTECTAQIPEFKLESHPAVEMARARAQREHGEGAASNRTGWFWPRFLQVSWYREQDKADRALVQVGIPVPLPGSSRVAVNDARYERRVEQLASVRFEVNQAVEQARSRLEGQRAVARLLDGEKVRYEEAQTLVNRGSEARVASAEIYQLKLALLEYQRRQAMARLELEAARIDLRMMMGAP